VGKIVAEHWVNADLKRVFAFFSDPRNLPRLMPKEMDVRLEELTLVPPPPEALRMVVESGAIPETVVESGSNQAEIVGRGSQHFLRNRQDALRVFLYAPKEDKVRRLIARGKNDKEAGQLVDTVDRERADFIQKYFHVEWPDRSVYHTMINTVIGDEAVLHTILDLVKTLDAKSRDTKVTA